MRSTILLASIAMALARNTCSDVKARYLDDACCGAGEKTVCVGEAFDTASIGSLLSQSTEWLKGPKMVGVPTRSLPDAYLSIAKPGISGAVASASSSYPTSDGKFSPGKALDDDESTAWASHEEYCDASFTITFPKLETIAAVGAQSRDMFDDPAYPMTNSSLITQFLIEVDGVPKGRCSLPDWYKEYTCVFPSPVTGRVWTWKAEKCNPFTTTAVENQGYKSVSLWQDTSPPPSPPCSGSGSAVALAPFSVNDLPECADVVPDDIALVYPPNAYEVEAGFDAWDLNRFLPGKEAFRGTVSGSWLCAIAAQSIDGTYPGSLIGTLKSQSLDAVLLANGTMPFPSTNPGTYPYTIGSGSIPPGAPTFMTGIASWCELVKVEADSDQKTIRLHICEGIYINAAIYRVEAFTTELEGTESYNLPEGYSIYRAWVDNLFGEEYVCPEGETCQVTLGAMTVSYPFKTYYYSDRVSVIARIASESSDVTTKSFASMVTNMVTIFGGPGGPIYDSHFRAAMDSAKGNSAYSLALPVRDKYPEHFEICATTQAFFDYLRVTPSKQTGRPLVCSTLIQKLLKGYSAMFAYEKEMLWDQKPELCYDTARYDADTNVGNVWTTLLPYEAASNSAIEGLGSDGTTLPFGTWGISNLNLSTFHEIYAQHQSIQCLHTNRFKVWCDAEADAALLGQRVFKPFGDAFAQAGAVAPGFWSWSMSFKWNSSWTTKEQVEASIPTSYCDPSAPAVQTTFCSGFGAHVLWSNDAAATCAHSGHVNSIYVTAASEAMNEIGISF